VTDLTFLDALVDALDAARRSTGGGGQIPPAALLWPDESVDWEPLAVLVASRLPVLTLGEYDLASRRGPAFWLRCVVDGSVRVEGLDDAAPVIYLPRFGKAQLRAVEETSNEIQPIAELQYRGAVFSQMNGKDWTLPAFLQAGTYGGLGIEVAADNATRRAIREARVQLASVRVSRLKTSAPLKAGFFNDLLAPDLPRLILEWLDDPTAFKAGCSDAEWSAFCEQFRQLFRLDLMADGPVKVAEYLGQRPDDAWSQVWERFLEAPSLYEHVPDRLRGARPAPSKRGAGLFDRLDAWPQVNEEEEDALRAALLGLSHLTAAQARTRIAELEQEHRDRRSWVWARLLQAPLAEAMAHIGELALATGRIPSGATVNAIAADYASTGWKADDAAMRALAAVSTAADVLAVEASVGSVYGGWLDEGAIAFQEAAAGGYVPEPAPDWPTGTCVIFSDGLRYDVGKRLESALADRGLAVELRPRLTALPTVTNTGKPFVSPARVSLGPGPGLDPAVADGGPRVTIDVLRKHLVALGYQVLGSAAVGDPTGLAWTELGDVDSLGHDQTSKLPRLLYAEVAALVDRIRALLAHGWEQVAVVTDHGWLYLPGGLPKVQLPQHLTVGGANRKARCARLDQGAATTMQTVPWTWDPTVAIAVPPGSSAFEAGQVYEHGGLSPQECVTPVLVIRGAAGSSTVATSAVSISVRWRGLRAVAAVAGAPVGGSLDLRRKAGDASTSVAQVVAVLASDGSGKLLVEDEDLLGTTVFAVVLDATGTVVGQAVIEVGADA
jgi:hypothetical protein